MTLGGNHPVGESRDFNVFLVGHRARMLPIAFGVDLVDRVLLAAVVCTENAVARCLLNPRGWNGKVHVVVGFVDAILPRL